MEAEPGKKEGNANYSRDIDRFKCRNINSESKKMKDERINKLHLSFQQLDTLLEMVNKRISSTEALFTCLNEIYRSTYTEVKAICIFP